jgi:hypothetical protein
VFSGFRPSAEGDHLRIQVCALVACAGSTVDTCNKPTADSSDYSINTVFSVLEVSSNALRSTSTTIPTVLLLDGFPFSDFTFTKPRDESSELVSLKADGYSGRIHTFGLYSI